MKLFSRNVSPLKTADRGPDYISPRQLKRFHELAVGVGYLSDGRAGVEHLDDGSRRVAVGPKHGVDRAIVELDPTWGRITVSRHAIDGEPIVKTFTASTASEQDIHKLHQTLPPLE